MWGWAADWDLEGQCRVGGGSLGAAWRQGSEEVFIKTVTLLKPLKNIRGGFPSVFCEDILILSTKPMEIVMYVFKIRFGEKFEVEIASL